MPPPRPPPAVRRPARSARGRCVAQRVEQDGPGHVPGVRSAQRRQARSRADGLRGSDRGTLRRGEQPTRPPVPRPVPRRPRVRERTGGVNVAARRPVPRRRRGPRRAHLAVRSAPARASSRTAQNPPGASAASLRPTTTPRRPRAAPARAGGGRYGGQRRTDEAAGLPARPTRHFGQRSGPNASAPYPSTTVMGRCAGCMRHVRLSAAGPTASRARPARAARMDAGDRCRLKGHRNQCRPGPGRSPWPLRPRRRHRRSSEPAPQGLHSTSSATSVYGRAPVTRAWPPPAGAPQPASRCRGPRTPTAAPGRGRRTCGAGAWDEAGRGAANPGSRADACSSGSSATAAIPGTASRPLTRHGLAASQGSASTGPRPPSRRATRRRPHPPVRPTRAGTGVAAGPPVQFHGARVVGGPAEQADGLVQGQRRDLDALHHADVASVGEGGEQPGAAVAARRASTTSSGASIGACASASASAMEPSPAQWKLVDGEQRLGRRGAEPRFGQYRNTAQAASTAADVGFDAPPPTADLASPGAMSGTASAQRPETTRSPAAQARPIRVRQHPGLADAGLTDEFDDAPRPARARSSARHNCSRGDGVAPPAPDCGPIPPSGPPPDPAHHASPPPNSLHAILNQGNRQPHWHFLPVTDAREIRKCQFRGAMSTGHYHSHTST